MAEAHVKKAVRAGNSSAVILPRAWLNKEVRVELVRKSNETILADVISILKDYINYEKVMGVYLVGSYARGEETDESDIDILVITSEVDMEMIKEGAYNIMVISYELLRQKLERDLLPIGQMIKESKALLNSRLISSLEVRVTRKNVRWYLDTTGSKLELVKKAINLAKKKNKNNLDNVIAYTLVLRIRTLHIIEKLAKNEAYLKIDFVRLVRSVSGGSMAYECYLAVKNNSNKSKGISIDEGEKLYEYLKEELEIVKKLAHSRI